MILLDRHATWKHAGRTVQEKGVVLRVHQDVVDLAMELAVRDRDKLLASTSTMFMPADVCWFEWPFTEGDAGIFSAGKDVQHGGGMFMMWRYGDAHEPIGWPFEADLEAGKVDLKLDVPGLENPMLALSTWETARPIMLAFLALINSPKMIRRIPAKLDRLNRKRAAVGRYTYHPHHTVRLNVDRKTFTVQEGDGGDGASRALHFVRAHLRFVNGSYVLVRPHWRGDPAVGIRSTSYEIDRQRSRWQN